jgi:hypothetical protein
MARTVIVARFGTEEDLLGATGAARQHGFRIADAYTPYAVHGLDRAMGLRPTWLPWVCFVLGLLAAGFALWSQHWAMADDWPVNVGGKPWNSLPAYVPVAFEGMVLLAGLGVVFAFFLRCRLYPGKQATLPARGVTDDRFVLVLENPDNAMDADVAHRLFDDFHALPMDEGEA